MMWLLVVAVVVVLVVARRRLLGPRRAKSMPRGGERL